MRLVIWLRFVKCPLGGPSLFLLFVFCLLLGPQPVPAQTSIHYALGCDSPGWEAILQVFGLSAATNPAHADILLACPGAQRLPLRENWSVAGQLLVLEGDSHIARDFGFLPSGKPAVEVRNVRDHHNPDLLTVWQHAERLVPTELPTGAKVLAQDRWSGIPLIATLRTDRGPILWLAISPGNSGYERFPYLGNALLDAGFVPPLRARNLWVFFDSAYRQRADLPFLARQWKDFGVAALHVSAWQHWERDPVGDAWLHRLIAACHQQGILVYAWLEFPHVSERFWQDHPSCREKTALGQDAQLDWRKLVNLLEPACAAPIRGQLKALLQAFPWDGVNLAEIYFESLEGAANPARFTPMNAVVRRDFAAQHGFDPAQLFDAASPRHHTRNAAGLQAFLAYRRQQIHKLHEDWLAVIKQATSHDLHLVVTQIDDRFDSSVRDNLAVDSTRILPLLHRIPFTYLVEDPATIWNLGPSRYQHIATAYATQTPYPERLAIDINIFPRYQEVYPTKQQTGVELYRLVNAAARAFPRVALYFEHTLSMLDLPLLASASSASVRLRREGDVVQVETARSVGLRWQGPALVNGRVWAAQNADMLWLPPGLHRVEPGTATKPMRLLHLGAEMQQVRASGRQLELHYQAESKAIASFSELPSRVWVDGEPQSVEIWKAAGDGYYIFLPPGEHLVRVETGEVDTSGRWTQE